MNVQVSGRKGLFLFPRTLFLMFSRHFPYGMESYQRQLNWLPVDSRQKRMAARQRKEKERIYKPPFGCN